MNYSIIENALVDLIKDLKLSDGSTKLAMRCEPYDGQVDSPFESTDSFNPGRRYVFPDMQSSAGTPQSITGESFLFAGDIELVVGSQFNSRLSAKKEVYEMIDILQKKLHRKTLSSGSTKIGRLRWKQDQKKFGTPNHICFSMIFGFETNSRIENA